MGNRPKWIETQTGLGRLVASQVTHTHIYIYRIIYMWFSCIFCLVFIGVPQLYKSKDEAAPNPVVHHHFPQQTPDEYLECTWMYYVLNLPPTKQNTRSICIHLSYGQFWIFWLFPFGRAMHLADLIGFLHGGMKFIAWTNHPKTGWLITGDCHWMSLAILAIVFFP